MPGLRPNDPVVAVETADWHLSAKVPVARAETKSQWCGVQAEALNAVGNIAEECGDVPVLCAGDIFDRWDSPPELINLALTNMPEVFAVAGNHDTPEHNPKQLHRSAYQTLVQADAVIHLNPGGTYSAGAGGKTSVLAVGFPHGAELDRRRGGATGLQTVAVVHTYCWWGNRPPNPSAKPEQHVDVLLGKLKGFDHVLFGDNHASCVGQGFANETGSWQGKTSFVNAGCLIRRRTDERKYAPAVWLLHRSGDISAVELKHTERWREGVTEVAAELVGLDADDFLEELRGLADFHLRFDKAVDRFCDKNNVPRPAKQLARAIVEEALRESE